MKITLLVWCLSDLFAIHIYKITPFSVFQLAEALDKTFKSLNQPADYKELKGKDPPTVELLHKIEQVNKKNTVQAAYEDGKKKDLDSGRNRKNNVFWIKNLIFLERFHRG